MHNLDSLATWDNADWALLLGAREIYDMREGGKKGGESKGMENLPYPSSKAERAMVAAKERSARDAAGRRRRIGQGGEGTAEAG